MTNGEKIQTILDVDRDCTEVHGKNGIMTFSVSQDWWNAEYQEPSNSEKPNKSEIPTSSTTKNDLGVDCISRKAVLDAIDSKAWEFCDYLISKGRNDEQKPVSHFADNLRECVREEIPSVTPIRPKGHWKLVQRGKCIDVCCSNCKAVRIKEYAYNYTIDQLDKQDVEKCLESHDMRYCPCCGSDNREVEE